MASRELGQGQDVEGERKAAASKMRKQRLKEVVRSDGTNHLQADPPAVLGRR